MIIKKLKALDYVIIGFALLFIILPFVIPYFTRNPVLQGAVFFKLMGIAIGAGFLTSMLKSLRLRIILGIICITVIIVAAYLTLNHVIS